MADDPNVDVELDITDEDAEKLLANDPPAGDDHAEPSATDDKDWKAEAERWKKMSRQNEAAAKQRADALKKYEDANKSESERLQEALVTHQSRAEKAEAALKRREIAELRAPEHATVAQIKAVAKRLAGESDDDLEADADELFALLAPAPAPPKTPSRPRERLRGGADPDEEPEENDPHKLAALVPRRR
jgi:murein DD-endopeptidase MepM/ murein hydrolase activator NlpD